MFIIWFWVFSNNFRLNWFKGTTSDKVANIAYFNFSTAFSNTNYSILTTTKWKSSSYDYSTSFSYVCAIVSKSSTQVAVHYIGGTNANTSYAVPFEAMAIGY